MIEYTIRAALNNRLLIGLAALLIALAGIYSYRRLPIDAFPDVSPNLVQVFTVTEGLAPEDVEKYVTYPVEGSMNGLPGIEKVRSISNFGLSVVNIYFDERIWILPQFRARKLRVVWVQTHELNFCLREVCENVRRASLLGSYDLHHLVEAGAILVCLFECISFECSRTGKARRCLTGNHIGIGPDGNYA